MPCNLCRNSMMDTVAVGMFHRSVRPHPITDKGTDIMTKQMKLNLRDIVTPKGLQLRGSDLSNAPIETLLGVDQQNASSLKSALGVSTVAELANHPSVLLSTVPAL